MHVSRSFHRRYFVGVDTAVEPGCHPSEGRMTDLALNIRKNLTGVSLIPAPVQVLGREAQLDDEVARQVLGLDLASFLLPKTEECRFVAAQDCV